MKRKRKFGFIGPEQVDLFMAWDEYWEGGNFLCAHRLKIVHSPAWLVRLHQKWFGSVNSLRQGVALNVLEKQI